MKKARLLVAAVTVAFLVAVLAPAAFASAGVTMHLSGPATFKGGHKVTLKLTINNPQKADGNRVAVLLQSRIGGLWRLASKQIAWNSSHTKGTCSFRIQPNAMSNTAVYRCAWVHPGGRTYSNRVHITVK
jgi:hypothetical protein